MVAKGGLKKNRSTEVKTLIKPKFLKALAREIIQALIGYGWRKGHQSVPGSWKGSGGIMKGRKGVTTHCTRDSRRGKSFFAPQPLRVKKKVPKKVQNGKSHQSGEVALQWSPTSPHASKSSFLNRRCGGGKGSAKKNETSKGNKKGFFLAATARRAPPENCDGEIIPGGTRKVKKSSENSLD